MAKKVLIKKKKKTRKTKTKYRANSLCRSIYIRKNNIFNSFVT